MKHQSLKTLPYVVQILKHRALRSGILILVVSLLSVVLFSGSILNAGLKKGADSLSSRLGADILVAPSGYQQKVQGALLRGEPSTIRLDPGILEQVSRINGVAKVSPQFYIASVSADCCAFPVQLIGFDPKTDFVIQPWIQSNTTIQLKTGEIMVGSSVDAVAGGSLKFFEREYKVVATLERTGMGFDTSVFMTMETAQIANTDYLTIAGRTDQQSDSIVSSIVLNVQRGFRVEDVTLSIKKALPGKVEVITTKAMVSTISQGLDAFSGFIGVLQGIFFAVAVGVLFLVFSVTLNERKNEFGTLRALGAGRSRIVRIILCESALISILGALSGVILGLVIVLPFNAGIADSLKMPFLQLKTEQVIFHAILSILITFLSGPLSACLSAFKIGKREINQLIREGI